MKIIARYSHKDGEAYIQKHFSSELNEIVQAIESVDIEKHKTKKTKETGSKFKLGQMLYSPVSMNKAIYKGLTPQGWNRMRISIATALARGSREHVGFREMDGVKNRLGLEIQFGKYAFMGYDILGKMPIFHNQGLIDAGVEVVPTKEIAIGHMSSGVSYYEQIVSDLRVRGAADLDVPTLILGIGFKNPPKDESETSLFDTDVE